MAKGPEWFQKLPKIVRDGIEQTGHFFMGVVAGLTSTYLWLWRRENIKQWPPGDPIWVYTEDGGFTDVDPNYPQSKEYFPADRVWDKAIDELAYSIGFTVGGLTRAGLLIYGGLKWW